MADEQDAGATEVGVTPSDKTGTDDSAPKGNLMELAASFFQASSGLPQSEIAQKVTSEHIGQVLAHHEKHDERILVDRRESRKLLVILAGMSAATLLILVAILVFSQNADLIQDIVQLIGAGVLGAFGGWGIRGGRQVTS